MSPIRLSALLLCLAVPCAPAGAQPLGTAFTYQGRLTEAAQPANGLYDLQVCLFDTPLNPVPLACAPDFADLPVEAGVFTLALDFGAAPFVGQQRFLELRVRPGASSGGYTILAPRQPVRPTPEALRAAAASAAPWSGLTGVPPGLADGIDNDSGGTVTQIVAAGGLSGGTITGSGTIGIAVGGVGSAQLADGGVAAIDVAADGLGAAQIAAGGVGASELADDAVDTAAVQALAITRAKIAAGAVGLAQVDATQVQARITGACAVGEYFRGVAADGTVACEPLPGIARNTVIEDAADPVGLSTSLAVAPDGLPVIAYFDLASSRLKVAKCGDSACSSGNQIRIVDDPANAIGIDVSLAIGSDGLPVIAYRDETDRALKVAKCGDAACAAGNQITVVDDPANDVGESNAIAIGTDGLPVISYLDRTASALKVLKCGNPACTSGNQITTVDDPPSGVLTNNTAIAVGGDGLPVVAYLDNAAGGPAIRVAKCGNPACSSGNQVSLVVDPIATTYLSVDVAIGALGRPIISFENFTSRSLRVAACTTASCNSGTQFHTVDDPPNAVGADSSIVVGPDGVPVISYKDSTAGALKVARCGTATCNSDNQVGTVDDPPGTAGNRTSIALGADGVPVTSHFDSGNGSLRVAKCGTRSCQ